jgi:carbonic anhydrase/acetyltransferase-like protein (isoleucine patch superfamily)
MLEALVLPFKGILPQIHPSAWIAPTAVVIGDTEIGEESSVWFGSIVRGDVNSIRIGKRVNIQDGVICHENSNDTLIIEDNVSVGHGAIIHGCKLEAGCLVGIGARILDRAVIGSGSLIAAGSVVKEGTIVPPGELWAGIPAVKKKTFSTADIQGLLDIADHYVHYRLHYMNVKEVGL